MWSARDAGVAKLSITSINTTLAGSNRSGKQRLLPSASDSEAAESTGSLSLAPAGSGSSLCFPDRFDPARFVSMLVMLICCNPSDSSGPHMY